MDNEDIKKDVFKMKKIIIFLIIFTLSFCLVLIYSRYVGTKGIKIKEYKITYSELSNDFYGLKIVHLTDIHYGRITFKKELNEIVEKINLTKPDIVVITGDLIDKDTKLNKKNINELILCLSKIDARIEKYAIKGNHDYKFKEWNSIISDSNFVDLNDSYDLIYTDSNKNILITGVSTNSYGKKTIKEKLSSTDDYLNSLDKKNKPNYSILLIHEPDFINEFDYKKYNLILAGHSHNGQVRIPIIGAVIKPDYSKKYYDEYYKINKTDLYISSGIGVSSINFRLLNPPSFNLYRLTNK